MSPAIGEGRIPLEVRLVDIDQIGVSADGDGVPGLCRILDFERIRIDDLVHFDRVRRIPRRHDEQSGRCLLVELGDAGRLLVDR